MKRTLIVIAATCLALAATVTQAGETDKPNILWIVSEDNGPWLGSYGDEVATTPRLDTLAAKSIRYTRAYSNAPVCAPTRSALITGAYPIAFGTENMRSTYKVPESIRFYPEYLREAGYYTSNNSKKDYNTVDRPQAWDESSSQAHWRNRAAGQPFFHVANLFVTHESRLHLGSLAENHDPADVQLFPFHPDTPAVRNDYAVYYDRLQDMDAQAGEILDSLQADGLAENTVIFYYADHGGAVAGTKRFLTENGLHVPLIIHVPEKFRHLVAYEAGSAVDRPVSFVDLTATLMQLAGIEKPAQMVGNSVLQTEGSPYVFAYGGRMDERINLVRSVSDGRYRYTRNYMPHRPYGRRLEYLWRAPLMQSWVEEYEAGRLNRSQSAFFEPRAAEELYDTQNDPHQLVNLVGQAGHAAKQEELSGALTAWQVEQRDAGLVPEAMLIEIDSKGLVRDYVASDAYPVSEIIDLAQAAGNRDPASLGLFLERLNSSHPVKAYWAATGILLLGEDARPALPVILEALESTEAWTGVVLAEALIGLEQTEPGKAYLAEALGHDNEMVRLAAMETIVETGLLDPGLEPTIAALVLDNPDAQPYDSRMAHYVIQLYEDNAVE